MTPLDKTTNRVNEIAKSMPKDVNCFTFYLRLKHEFPQAKPLYNGNHILTLIDNNLYDKTGCVFYNLEQEPRIFNQAFTWRE